MTNRRRRILGLIGAGILLCVLVFNWMAYRQAFAMLHYTTGGERTPSPEKLTWRQKLGVIVCGVENPKPLNDRTPVVVGLAFTTHRIAIDSGSSLEVWRVPATSPLGVVVMFHGYSACKSMMLDEARAFVDLGWTVWMVDFRGSGGSTGSETTLGYREAVDIGAAVEFVRRQESPVLPLVLFGQSMGGVAILRSIADHGVVVDRIIIESVFDTLLNSIRNRFASMGLPAFPAAEVLCFWGGRQFGFSGFALRADRYAESVACPVLMLHGGSDVRALPGQARRVYDALSGDARFELFDDVGHESIVARRPAQWQFVVAEFLQAR
ncbi:MAG: alpha/beta hydrolase [Verrucomicrobia bacterium]|nr:alpha/beta hydrolase [Verrucomicrobiota bacterium]